MELKESIDSTKKCGNCKEVKSINNFHKSNTKSCGYVSICKKCANTKSKLYRKNNKKIIKEKRDSNKDKNKGKYTYKNKNYQKTYREENKERIRQNRKANKNKINKKLKEKMKTDSLFKLKSTLRVRIYTMFKFKHWKKNKHTEDILGADYETVKQHLEGTFQDKMSWSNHGKWHIDHIIPLNSAKTEQDLYKLCHYTNLQALWAFDNLSKSDKM